MVIRRTGIRRLILAISLTGFVLVSHAQDFEELSIAQQELLAPLEEHWDGLSDAQKNRLSSMATRVQDKTPQQKERFQQGLDDFVTMQPDKRRQVRALFNRFRHLPPQERQRVIERVSMMSEEEKGAFALGMRIADRTHRFGGPVERFCSAS